MGELGEEHRAEVAHHAEGARLGIHSGLVRMAVDHAERNEIEKLLEDNYCTVLQITRHLAGDLLWNIACLGRRSPLYWI